MKTVWLCLSLTTESALPAFGGRSYVASPKRCSSDTSRRKINQLFSTTQGTHSIQHILHTALAEHDPSPSRCVSTDKHHRSSPSSSPRRWFTASISQVGNNSPNTTPLPLTTLHRHNTHQLQARRPRPSHRQPPHPDPKLQRHPNPIRLRIRLLLPSIPLLRAQRWTSGHLRVAGQHPFRRSHSDVTL